MGFWRRLLKFERMIRYRECQLAWSNILLQLHDLTNGSFVVEGAIRVLQAAALLEWDPDTRGSGRTSNGARRSDKRKSNSEEGGLAEHDCRLVRGKS